MGTVPAPNIVQDAMQISQAPQNALAEYARVAQLKQATAQAAAMAPLQQQAAQQQIEMQRRQMADQDALTKAMTAYNTEQHTPDDIPKLITQNGGSGQAALAAQQHILQLKDTASQVAQRDADTGSKNLDTYLKRHDAAAGAIQAAIDTDDATLGDRLGSKVAELGQSGFLRPDEVAHGQQLAELAKQNPQAARAQLPAYLNGFKTEKQIFEEAQKNAEQQQKDWEIVAPLGLRVNKVTGEQQPISGAAMSPQMMESKYVALLQKKNQGQPLAPEDAAFVKSYEHMKELVPAFNMNMAVTGGGLGPTGGGAPGAGGGPAAAPTKAVANAPGGWASAGGKTLNDVPPAIRAEVQQVLEYRRADPSITQRGPVGQAINAWVAELDPQHDATTFGARNKILNEYVKDASTGEIGAINTALGHLGDLYQASQALNQNNIPLLHSIASKFGLATGGTAESVYEGILHRVGPEMTKAYLKSGGTEGERGSNENDFALSKGQAQIQNNIFESANLLNSKLASKRNDWENTFQPYRDRDHFDARFVTPDARQMLQQLGSQSPLAKGGGGSPGSFTVKAPNNKTYTFKDQASADRFKQAAGIQ